MGLGIAHGDMRELRVEDLLDGVLTILPTGFSFETTGATFYAIVRDFAYTADGVPTAGVITNIFWSVGDKITVSLSGSGLPVVPLSQLLLANAPGAALEALFSGKEGYQGSDRADVILGFGGDDAIQARGGPDTIFGGDGDDLIWGFDGPVFAADIVDNGNYLRGDAGNDRIAGAGGFDDINGNTGNDTCTGGKGDDWVVGGKDNDLLFGDFVDERFEPGSRPSSVNFAGADIVYGNLGNDTCFGDGGADTVRGGQGDDSISGGDGNDFLSGDLGADTISGGAGADLFNAFVGTGTDLITDFRASEGDRLRVEGDATWTLRQVGADTLVDLAGGGQVVLQNVSLTSLATGWIFNG